MARIRTISITFPILYLSLQYHVIHGIASNTSGLRFKMIPRDCPESPLYQGNLTQSERMENLIKLSDSRSRYLEQLMTSSDGMPDSMGFPMLRDNLYYVVQYTIGDPSIKLLLLMDSGSGLVWTQCLPCKNCYPQKVPLYNRTASSSFQKLPCDDPLCSGETRVFDCVNDECVYSIAYGGGANTKGIAALETVTVPPPYREPTWISNVVFGCSDDNAGFGQLAKSGLISGIFGLSLSRTSWITRLSDLTKGRFSYCLVPYDQAMTKPGELTMGDAVPQPTGTVPRTPFLNPPKDKIHLYYLNLTDISVANERLGFTPGMFDFREGGAGGFIIDSGVTISRLEENTIGLNAYRTVMVAFRRYYDAQKLTRIPKVVHGFQLCYMYPPGFSNFASMTYHFDGADYVVDPNYVNFYQKDQNYFCVALLPGSRTSSLGAWHQQNMRIIYDAEGGPPGALKFAPENCPSA